MNNAVDSVPARIVIIGTSKMRLSERFNKLQKAPPPSSPAPQQQVFLKRESVSGVTIGPVIGRPRVVDERDRPNNRIQNSKSFLHDDYMDNDLYGDAMEPFVRRPQMGGFRSANLYEGFEPAPDPLKLTLDAYDQYSRFRSSQRRSIHSRITETSRSRFRNLPVYDESEDGFYGDYDEPPRSRLYNQNISYNRRPIHHRLSFKPMRLSGFDFLRRPFHRNTMQFKRPFYSRGSNFSFGRRRSNDWSRRGAPVPFGRRGRWGDKRMKKSVAEMDRELEEYMRSSKHPRVKPIKPTD